jgi:hypothetical protein
MGTLTTVTHATCRLEETKSLRAKEKPFARLATILQMALSLLWAVDFAEAMLSSIRSSENLTNF